MTSAGVVLAETVCVKNSHLSPLGHTRHTRHAGHISTNPQVNALPIDLSGALGGHPVDVRRHRTASMGTAAFNASVTLVALQQSPGRWGGWGGWGRWGVGRPVSPSRRFIET